MIHAMPIFDYFKYATLCGIKSEPLLLISVISAWHLKKENDPCSECLEIINKMEK